MPVYRRGADEVGVGIGAGLAVGLEVGVGVDTEVGLGRASLTDGGEGSPEQPTRAIAMSIAQAPSQLAIDLGIFFGGPAARYGAAGFGGL